MTRDTIIPIVDIEHYGDYKFIEVVTLEGRTHIFGNRRVQDHRIGYNHVFLKPLQKKGIDVSDFVCTGGGSIDIDLPRKIVHVYGKSTSFGKFDQQKVNFLIGSYMHYCMEGFSLKLE